MDEKLRKRFGYEAIEQYDTERLAKLQEHYAAIFCRRNSRKTTARW